MAIVMSQTEPREMLAPARTGEAYRPDEIIAPERKPEINQYVVTTATPSPSVQDSNLLKYVLIGAALYLLLKD